MAAPVQAGYPWHPSTDRLVRSALNHIAQSQLIGVLMTGMGNDGAEAMALMHEQGGRTIAEAEENCRRVGHARGTYQSRRRRLCCTPSQDSGSIEGASGLMPLIRKPSAPTTGIEPDFETIAENLLKGADDERWSAARSAAEVPNGISVLAAALSKESVPRVCEAIYTALAKIGTPESAAVVLPHLRSDDAARRTGALDALRAMPLSREPTPSASSKR